MLNSFSSFRKSQNLLATNYFKSKGYTIQTKYPFILKDRDNWELNIIKQEVAEFIKLQKSLAEAQKDAFPIHKYIHHGLSSQAMLFNLLGEPTLKKDYAFFQDLFGYNDIKIDESYEMKFEHSCRKTFNENQSQPTSFDFAVYNESRTSKNIFVEAKYVEAEFGGCSAIIGGECDGLNPIIDAESCFLTAKGRNYWDKMKDYELDVPFYNSPICPFVIYYQFYRELMFALENNGYYVILCDKRNPAFNRGGNRGLIPLLLNLVPKNLHSEIKIIYIQDVVPILRNYGYDWVDEFCEKYGI